MGINFCFYPIYLEKRTPPSLPPRGRWHEVPEGVALSGGAGNAKRSYWTSHHFIRDATPSVRFAASSLGEEAFEVRAYPVSVVNLT